MLPASFTSSYRLTVGNEPFASGGCGDVYHGTLDGSKVCVRRARVYATDDQSEAAKVRSRPHYPLRPPLPMIFTDLLQGSGNMEVLETPKNSAYIGRRHHTLSVDLGFCARQGSVKQHQEPQRKQTVTGGCRSYSINPAPTHYQLSDTAEGLCYLHSCNVIHGDPKGVRGSEFCLAIVFTLN